MDAAALALFAYMVLSLAWTLDWRQGLYSLVNAGALLCVFLWVRHTRHEHVALLPGAACVSLFVAFLAQQVAPWDFGGHGNRTFQAELMLCVLALGLSVRNIGARMAVAFCGLPIVAYLALENDAKVEWFVLLCLAPVFAWRTIRYLRHTTSPSLPVSNSG